MSEQPSVLNPETREDVGRFTFRDHEQFMSERGSAPVKALAYLVGGAAFGLGLYELGSQVIQAALASGQLPGLDQISPMTWKLLSAGGTTLTALMYSDRER